MCICIFIANYMQMNNRNFLIVIICALVSQTLQNSCINFTKENERMPFQDLRHFFFPSLLSCLSFSHKCSRLLENISQHNLQKDEHKSFSKFLLKLSHPQLVFMRIISQKQSQTKAEEHGYIQLCQWKEKEMSLFLKRRKQVQ